MNETSVKYFSRLCFSDSKLFSVPLRFNPGLHMTLLRRTTKGLFSGLLVLFCCLIFPLHSQAKPAGDSGKSSVSVKTDRRKPATAHTAGHDSTVVSPAAADSMAKKDSIAGKKNQTLTEIVDYSATDSLVFGGDGTGQLYGASTVTYGDLNLNAGYIKMNMDSSLLYATGRPDSVGKIIETPVFKDKSGEYQSKNLRYNFKSKKGMISQVVTQQGEGYVVSETTKKQADDIMCMVNGKYTTCDNHEHPHFYLDLSKAKVKPGSYIISGPAHLVMEDVDLPLFLPFGYFPFKGNYSSGILTPTYGDELSRGFYLKDMGYYFAFNDYMDLALTGELYSKGSWGIKARSSYRVKYKFSGSFNASYIETVTGEKNLPDYAKEKDLNVTWTHSQDAKANPYRTLSASVNFATSGYTRNDLASYYDAEAFSTNTKSSSVSLTQRFPDSPFSLSASASISQRSSDSTMSVVLPTLNVSMSSIYPFKRKNAVGDERWYEKIHLNYTGTFSNKISSVKEQEFLNKSLIKDWINSIKHSIPVSATFSVLNYINLTPSFTYTESWYSSSLNKTYDNNLEEVVIDTTWGFNRVYEYSTSLSASTVLYGMFQPNQKIFGDKINMIRHVLTPTIAISYHPDFGAKRYGYYGTYSYLDADGDETSVTYSRYSHVGSSPSRGESKSIDFSLSNNLEMKLKQKTDTAVVFKKVSLIDDFTIGSSYNMAADSLNWSDIAASIRLKFGSKYTLNLSGSFDPYTYILDSSGDPVQVNTTQFEKYGIPGRLISTGTSFSYTLNNDTFKKRTKQDKKNGSAEGKPTGGPGAEATGTGGTGGGGAAATDGKSPNGTPGTPPEDNKPYDPEAELYAPCKIPWSLSLNYSLRYARSDFNEQRLEYDHEISQNVSFSGNIALTDKWKFTASTSYNFNTKKLTTMTCSASRDLHCWQMSASFIPIGSYKSYSFSISVKASILKDLKYDQHQNSNDNSIW
jgi:hypothetical protein